MSASRDGTAQAYSAKPPTAFPRERCAEDLIAGPGVPDVGSHGVNAPGKIRSDDLLPWLKQLAEEGKEEQRSPDRQAVERIDGGGEELDPHLVVSGHGKWNFPQLEHLWRSVARRDDGSQAMLLTASSRENDNTSRWPALPWFGEGRMVAAMEDAPARSTLEVLSLARSRDALALAAKDHPQYQTSRILHLPAE
ncbi:MAG TPA: hypothetical protein VGD62_11030 [Acidobacteriaceae bacterium]